MPVHEVAESTLVDAQVLLGCRSDTSGAVVSTVPPMHPTGRQHMPIGARSLTGGDMGGALCDVGGTGSPSARGRAVRRSWRKSTYSVPGPEGHRYAAENGSVRFLTPPMPTDDTASRRRMEPLRRPHSRSM